MLIFFNYSRVHADGNDSLACIRHRPLGCVLFFRFQYIIALVLVALSGILLIPDVDENNSYRICADCTTSGPSDRTKTRSVSPDMSTGRSLSRNDRTTPLNSRSEYDQMPRPMLTPVEKTGSANRNLRPATFNNISAVTLQRDRAGY